MKPPKMAKCLFLSHVRVTVDPGLNLIMQGAVLVAVVDTGGVSRCSSSYHTDRPGSARP